ncbi:hypothetical protein XELAEV_18018007mg [Xenopus laevis]|uniref:Uncharacterized protein n=1 Tax=Xenopus laevis TaxID=8355 RepID=A0A974HTJ6_XENLA|nr:hypothetical protein XELAEV_18018007mg [Xenopus laevis]
MVFKQVQNTEMSWDKDGKYAMGWGTVEEKQECGNCKHQKHYVSHTGGVAASSAILILPEEENTIHLTNERTPPPNGIVVAIICRVLVSTAQHLRLH